MFYEQAKHVVFVDFAKLTKLNKKFITFYFETNLSSKVFFYKKKLFATISKGLQTVFLLTFTHNKLSYSGNFFYFYVGCFTGLFSKLVGIRNIFTLKIHEMPVN